MSELASRPLTARRALSRATRCVVLVLAGLAVTACDLDATPEEDAGDDEEPPFTNCTLGSLTGNWAFHYTQLPGGDCGAPYDHEGILDADRPISGCRMNSSSVSADKCQMDLALTCGTADGLGTQAWSLRIRQVAADSLRGAGQLQIEHQVRGVCRSNYNIEINQIDE